MELSVLIGNGTIVNFLHSVDVRRAPNSHLFFGFTSNPCKLRRRVSHRRVCHGRVSHRRVSHRERSAAQRSAGHVFYTCPNWGFEIVTVFVTKIYL